MTNEEAIIIIENERPHCGRRITFTEEEKCEAFDMAIEAINFMQKIKELNAKTNIFFDDASEKLVDMNFAEAFVSLFKLVSEPINTEDVKNKTKEQVQQECKCRDVFTTEEFWKYVENGSFNEYDGTGYYHDGENETDLCVWDYPSKKGMSYVCWYNK